MTIRRLSCDRLGLKVIQNRLAMMHDELNEFSGRDPRLIDR
jgi:hypothetical protein